MIDIEKLKYDLAMQSALAMTLQGFQKGVNGHSVEMMMINFVKSYQMLSDEKRAERLEKLIKELFPQNNSL